jgi:hypothetical protein
MSKESRERIRKYLYDNVRIERCPEGRELAILTTVEFRKYLEVPVKPGKQEEYEIKESLKNELADGLIDDIKEWVSE